MKTDQSVPSLINVGIIGLGTIGSAVAENLRKNAEIIRRRTGMDVRVKKACDIKPRKTPFPFTRDPLEIIDDPEISIIVEAIGGVDPALKYILAALDRGKTVVTPNKEVIAKHAGEIFSRRGAVFFEGAVGGGIPIIRALRAGLAANRISEIYGIVNGTTNYVLSKMTEEGKEFNAALAEAQGKGFAEADPKADIEGYDAQYKAAILVAAAWGAETDLKKISREGIAKITQEDIRYAGEIGYAIKLLAVARQDEAGLDIRVHPALVNKHHPLAAVAENFNAIYVKGKPIGEVMFYGPGAGGDPTSSAIISDIISAARGESAPMKLIKPVYKNAGEIVNRYYFHLKVPDRPGTLARIARVLADNKVSIQAVVQKETVGSVATLIIILHEAKEANIQRALQKINKLSVVHKVCNAIRIL